MSDAIRFEHKDLDGYAKAMKAAPAAMKRELPIAINRVTTEGQGRSRRHLQGHNDTGRLRNNLAVEPARAVGGGFRGTWGTNVTYAKPVEDGRRAGAAMPPQGALLGWLSRHGIPASAEFVVRRAISRRGIRPVFYMKRARAEVRPIARRELRAAMARVLAGIRKR